MAGIRQQFRLSLQEQHHARSIRFSFGNETVLFQKARIRTLLPFLPQKFNQVISDKFSSISSFLKYWFLFSSLQSATIAFSVCVSRWSFESSARAKWRHANKTTLRREEHCHPCNIGTGEIEESDQRLVKNLACEAAYCFVKPHIKLNLEVTVLTFGFKLSKSWEVCEWQFWWELRRHVALDCGCYQCPEENSFG